MCRHFHGHNTFCCEDEHLSFSFEAKNKLDSEKIAAWVSVSVGSLEMFFFSSCLQFSDQLFELENFLFSSPIPSVNFDEDHVLHGISSFACRTIFSIVLSSIKDSFKT